MSADRPPVDVFVAGDGNAFMTDLAGWLVEAAALSGRDARLVSDGRLPVDTGTVGATNLVVAPHEFYLLTEASDRDVSASAAISVPIATEQPGTRWFEMTELAARSSPLTFDINADGAAALRASGVDAHHLRIGGVPSMDRRSHRDGDRANDVVFLGGRTAHRAERLADLAPLLWDRRSDLRLFSFSRPVTEPVGGVVFGAAKYDLLAASRILVNIHRDGGRGYFEWARMVEAMANGVAVVTEPSTGYDPLVPGEHFVMTDDLVGAVEELLDDPARVAEMGERAAAAVLSEHPMTATLGPALDLAEAALAHAATNRSRPLVPARIRTRLERAQQLPLLPAFRPNTATRRRVFAAWSAEVDLQRRIDAVRCARRHGSPDHAERVESSSYATAEPDVSVIVTLFDYADLVVETLESVAASRDVSFEIVVVDDHSRDDGRDVVRRYQENHPELPLLLIGHDANRGLPESRNRAVRESRADKVMVLDADNLVYPTCLERLSAALDRDPDAAFAYAILEEFGDRRGLQSAMGWNPAWLCEANYIDAQAMLRRSSWERAGGYLSGDPHVYGWEDWELWLRLAAAGEYGVHVPEILGRYRTQSSSMIATSNRFGDLMLDHLRDLHPELPWPVA